MMKLLLLILAGAVLATCSTTSAFVSPSLPRHQRPMVLFSDFHPEEMENTNSANPLVQMNTDTIEIGPLALKMAAVLTVKTAKDVVNYPPKLFDTIVRKVRQNEDEMTPVVMLAKLMGVLVFKVAHDAVYYPMIWSQRMVKCQSLEECEVPDE